MDEPVDTAAERSAGDGKPGVAVLSDVRDALAELAPVLRRAVGLDSASLARITAHDARLGVLVRLPFAVLVARTVAADTPTEFDLTAGAAAVLSWIDEPTAELPERLDEQWRTGIPPRAGWVRVDTVPDDVVRGLVRAGAMTLVELAQREGVGAAQPRAEVSDTLLDSVVLTVTDDAGHRAEVTLRAVSALTRMGFLPRKSHISIDVAGRWTRVAAAYGSVYLERAGLGLDVLRR